MAHCITIQLIKCWGYDKTEIFERHGGFQTLCRYAPEDAYDYFMLGEDVILAKIGENVLKADLVPFLRDFYEEFYGNDCLVQREAVINEFSKYDIITTEICEKIGYEMEDKFYPCFVNDKHPHPYHMSNEGIDLNPFGIILYKIPLEKATFAMLENLENDLVKKWESHPLVKALRVCVI